LVRNGWYTWSLNIFEVWLIITLSQLIGLFASL
jgi:hypothetical protein